MMAGDLSFSLPVRLFVRLSVCQFLMSVDEVWLEGEPL